ncbi:MULTISPECIES: alpha/beta fold hydrolase [unclassified Thioclava]|uniref:alpha/beta hydrolase n=1 Tax=unclassified Thioclava TaxID=2621713 RepID=UPI000B545413|nr:MULTISPECIES: alpha/beta fold hydrolase [unclassified Thioclava]OWY07087.1 phospholipase [Thioclava sp. IC9]OWY16983.1 phospholipase [Thioclava sp. JM3]
MTRKLDAGRREPQSGTVKSAVVFLHGYGADGADLLGLADPLGQHLPDTLFLAPDAPEPCRAAPYGRQWFPIPWIDNSSEAESAQGLKDAAADVDAFLDSVLEEQGLTPAQLAVIGFSQGTMTALEVLPRRAEPVAGLVAFSGRLLRPEALGNEAISKPPVLLIHGDQDPVVPFADMGKAGDALVSAGFDTYAHVMKGTGHGIAPDGLSVALSFLQDKLPG